MGTEANGHLGDNGEFVNGHLGQMGTGAYGHWVNDKRTLGANGHRSTVNGDLGQIFSWGKLIFGASRHLRKWAPAQMGTWGKMGIWGKGA